jgi:predicted N-acetyltransferase YhbS
MLSGRELSREEIETIWSIDRSEVIDAVYYFEQGALVLKPEHYDLHTWPSGEPEKYAPLLAECFEQGGWFYGLFDGAQLAGVAVLENRLMGSPQDQFQLKFLQLGRAFRGQGHGRRLFELAKTVARERGAKRLYISATPSEHTIGFYFSMGCVVTAEPDPELFALEPEDIHLECSL